MEYAGSYYEQITLFLHNEAIYVSMINAILIHNYSGNFVRKANTFTWPLAESARVYTHQGNTSYIDVAQSEIYNDF